MLCLIFSAVHKSISRRNPGASLLSSPADSLSSASTLFSEFILAKGEEELSKDLAQVPGRELLLRVAGKQKRGGKERQSKHFHPHCFHSKVKPHISPHPFPPTPKHLLLSYQLFHIFTYIRLPFPKYPPQMPHNHKLL